jgi:hypothetical protein
VPSTVEKGVLSRRVAGNSGTSDYLPTVVNSIRAAEATPEGAKILQMASAVEKGV